MSASVRAERLEQLIQAYREALRAAVAAHPEEYRGFHHDDVVVGNTGTAVARKQTVDEYVDSRIVPELRLQGIAMISTAGSRGWRGACRALGIRDTRKAITAFLNGDPS